MGNCLRRESRSMVWAGDDWGSLTSSKNQHQQHDAMFVEEADHDDDNNNASYNMERQRLLGDMGAFSKLSSSSTSSSNHNSNTREVKIKITKKELEELVRRDMQGLSVKQVLARLTEAADEDKYVLEHQRSWRPALQSIPEVN
jgi:hypothetical protein|uniref:Uncharacterized protein n=1 Tax=Fagus sylvatica TaxID=28930 RepID=A0A2N9F043_FAGSY